MKKVLKLKRGPAGGGGEEEQSRDFLQTRLQTWDLWVMTSPGEVVRFPNPLASQSQVGTLSREKYTSCLTPSTLRGEGGSRMTWLVFQMKKMCEAGSPTTF